ncbi:MAG: SBBP repeat-containing protein [Alphaproteobacteria bacterium]
MGLLSEVAMRVGVVFALLAFLSVPFSSYADTGPDYETDWVTIKLDSAGEREWKKTVNSYSYYSSVFLKVIDLLIGSSGDLYLVGSDFTVIKYHLNGQWVWQGYSSDYDVYHAGSYAAAIDTSDNIFVVGVINESWDEYCAVVRYQADGSDLWNVSFLLPGQGSVQECDVAVDVSGYAYAVCGLIDSSLLAAYDAEGKQQWLEKDSRLSARAIHVDQEEALIIAGYSGSDGIALSKRQLDGVELWRRTDEVAVFSSNSYLDVSTDAEGNIYIVTSFLPAPKADYLVVKYDSEGNEQWASTYDVGNGEQVAQASFTDEAGNTYVTGNSRSDSGQGTLFATVKFNANGKNQWSDLHDHTPGSDNNEAAALAVDAMGNVYVAGYAVGDDGCNDYVIIKYDPEGVILWESIYDGPRDSWVFDEERISLNYDDYAKAIAVDESGNVYIAGESYTERSEETEADGNSNNINTYEDFCGCTATPHDPGLPLALVMALIGAAVWLWRRLLTQSKT